MEGAAAVKGKSYRVRRMTSISEARERSEEDEASLSTENHRQPHLLNTSPGRRLVAAKRAAALFYGPPIPWMSFCPTHHYFEKEGCVCLGVNMAGCANEWANAEVQTSVDFCDLNQKLLSLNTSNRHVAAVRQVTKCTMACNGRLGVYSPPISFPLLTLTSLVFPTSAVGVTYLGPGLLFKSRHQSDRVHTTADRSLGMRGVSSERREDKPAASGGNKRQENHIYGCRARALNGKRPTIDKDNDRSHLNDATSDLASRATSHLHKTAYISTELPLLLLFLDKRVYHTLAFCLLKHITTWCSVCLPATGYGGSTFTALLARSRLLCEQRFV
ncbi:hypothetical protein V8F06_005432 [Rhypophila decipiens]